MVAVVVLARAHAADPAPRPAPPLFVSQSAGVIAVIPPGLTYCPLPATWTGSDHGTEVYLTPPARCGVPRTYASSSRLSGSFAPAVAIFYGRNVAFVPRSGRDDSPPETNAELAGLVCGDDDTPLPPGITLLGAPAAGCRVDEDGGVDFRATAVYAAAAAPGARPDRILIVSLDTTPDRVASDLPVFRRIAGGIQVCGPPAEGAGARRERCPAGVDWW